MTTVSSRSKALAPPIWILAMAVSGANMGLSLLSPAITVLRTDFVASADVVQLVLGVFMVAVGLGQLVAGTLSDRFGRRPVLLVGAALFTVAGAAAFFAQTIESLIVFRLFQGFGAASCMAMGRVIINDSFAHREAGRQMATVTMIQTIVPILGFAFGGLIAETIGWRGSVAIMVASAALTFIAAFALLVETKTDKAERINVASVFAAYASLARNRLFGANALNSAMIVGMFFAMGGVMPYEFARYGLTPAEYGMHFCLTSVGYMFGNSISRYMAPRYGLDITAFIGGLGGIFAISGMLIVDFIDPPSAVPLTICCIIFGLVNGLTMANAMVGAVKAAGPYSGSATGVVGFTQMMSGAVFGSLAVALGGDMVFANAGMVLFAMAIASALGSFWALDPRAWKQR